MTSRWWTPEHHIDRRPGLLLRAALMRDVRRWFETGGFIEVEPSCLQISPGNETHLHAFKTELIDPSGEASALYLHTSPEFAMKKLLAAGETKIFSLLPAFRNRESGPLHLPEFTMLEWYRTGVDYQAIMQDCIQVLQIAAAARGDAIVSYRGRTCDLSKPPERLSVADAFQRYAQIDILATLRADPREGDREAMAEQARATKFLVAATDTWSDIFSKLLVARIEPNLGNDRPTLLTAYPLPEAALARPSRQDPRVGERFELYCCGIELANGFSELTDATEQRRRFEHAMREKQDIYGESYPIDETFLDALTHMPDAAGVALGFDRLALLVAGATRLDQVVWTPPQSLS